MKLQAFALVGAVFALVVLTGCETMSAEECATANWRQLGYSDADRNGTDNLADRAESCAEKGISADAQAYHRGFEDGLRAFCQPPRGFDFARRGGSFNGYCPGDLDQDFRYAYADGRRVYDLQQTLILHRALSTPPFDAATTSTTTFADKKACCRQRPPMPSATAFAV